MIICECGHGIFHHGREGCSYAISHTHKLNELEFCGCELTTQAVEARYWARRMMKERDAWKNADIRLFDEMTVVVRDRDNLRNLLEEYRIYTRNRIREMKI
jgi:hypothetical protein